MSFLRDVASKDGMQSIVLFSYRELRSIKAKAGKQGTNIPSYLLGDVKSLQFYLKNLQEKGMFSLDGIFDYSSIDESDFRKSVNEPASMLQISSGRDTQTYPIAFMKINFKRLF